MIVTLDGERLTETFPKDGTLQTLVDHVREQHLGDRLVVSVAVDGQSLTEGELGDQLGSPIAEASQVDLTSADRWQLVSDALREVAQRLGEAANEHFVVADQLHAGKVSEAIGSFGSFLEVWQVCQRLIVECSGLLGKDLTAIECQQRPLRQHLDELANKLRELRDVFEARDAVSLADLMQYELPDTCRQWQAILADLAERVAAKASTSNS